MFVFSDDFSLAEIFVQTEYHECDCWIWDEFLHAHLEE